MTPPCASVTSASRRKQPASPHYAGPVPFAAILLQDPINVLLFEQLDKVISARDLPELNSCGVIVAALKMPAPLSWISIESATGCVTSGSLCADAPMHGLRPARTAPGARQACVSRAGSPLHRLVSAPCGG